MSKRFAREELSCLGHCRLMGMNPRASEKDFLHIPVPLDTDVGGIRGSERRSVFRCLSLIMQLERHQCPPRRDAFHLHRSTHVDSIWGVSPDAQTISLGKYEGDCRSKSHKYEPARAS